MGYPIAIAGGNCYDLSMEQHLIDCPDQWDAAQLIAVAKSQVWDETIGVLAPELDSRRDIIPDAITDRVFASPAYQLLSRIDARIRESWGS